MDFFRRQDDARRFSRWLVLLFVLAVAAVVLAVNLVVLTIVANAGNDSQVPVFPGPRWLAANPGPALWTTLVVAGLIGMASLFKTAQLQAGGGYVALSLGGQRVLPEGADPLHRRLLNVVEEMAIASGVPVPEVYVLEQEAGINAFAAGLNPADAAIAVTRGALEQLERAELQGVIGHEFSHILNGDMRLNTRLIGLLFGLVMLALAARLVLHHAPRAAGRRGRANGAVMLIVAVAALVLAIGSVGVFFGRLIQAAVSRHRERLADASAVQFTRDTTGLRNALVKIGAALTGSRIVRPEAGEIAHMLFAPARAMAFATHPPLEERIRTLDPGFDRAEFGRTRQAMDAALRAGRAVATAAGEDTPPAGTAARERLAELIGVGAGAGVLLAPAALPGLVGNPLAVHVAFAAALREALPGPLVAATRDGASAAPLLMALCLDADQAVRDQQRNFVARQLGEGFADRVTDLLVHTDGLHPAQRLPTLLKLLPALRRQAADERRRLLAVLHALLQREGARLSLPAYALRKLAHTELQDELEPGPDGGNLGLGVVRNELAVLFAVLAGSGNDEAAANAAYRAGLGHLLSGTIPPRAVPENWPARLDRALNRLDRLAPAAKSRLVEALGLTVAHDRRLAIEEAELLRAICAVLHCPLPPLVAVAGP